MPQLHRGRRVAAWTHGYEQVGRSHHQSAHNGRSKGFNRAFNWIMGSASRARHGSAMPRTSSPLNPSADDT